MDALLSDYLQPLTVSCGRRGNNTSALVRVQCDTATLLTAVYPVDETVATDAEVSVTITPLFSLIRQWMNSIHAVQSCLRVITTLCRYARKDGVTPTYGGTDTSEYAYLLDTSTTSVLEKYILYYDPIRAGKPFPFSLTVTGNVVYPLYSEPLFMPTGLAQSILNANTPVLEMIQTTEEGTTVYLPFYRRSTETEQQAILANVLCPQGDFYVFAFYNEFGVKTYIALPGILTEQSKLEAENAVLANGVSKARIQADFQRTFYFKSSPLPKSLFHQAHLLLTSPNAYILQPSGAESTAELGTRSSSPAFETAISQSWLIDVREVECFLTEIKSEYTPAQTAEGTVVEFSFIQDI